MAKKKHRITLARGHEWALGRPTQTHGDKRKKRLGTRRARMRAAMEGG
jgi:hypothetical protein